MTDVAKATDWSEFIERVEVELRTGAGGFVSLGMPFKREQSLTRAIALGLRELFIAFYGSESAAEVHRHVVYREGDTLEDRKAWKAAQPEKWIRLHGLNFVPDVLIRPNLDPVSDVLPIEVKLVTRLACSQDVATAIGQAVAYSVRYPRSLVFIGVQHGVADEDHPLTNETSHSSGEGVLRDKLRDLGITLILRRVSTGGVGSTATAQQ